MVFCNIKNSRIDILMEKSNILVTGGMGFIGSHTVIELLNAGHEAIIVDNLSNSKAGVVDRIEKITGKRPAFYKTDVRDTSALMRIFEKENTSETYDEVELT